MQNEKNINAITRLVNRQNRDERKWRTKGKGWIKFLRECKKAQEPLNEIKIMLGLKKDPFLELMKAIAKRKKRLSSRDNNAT